ncbi:hypothetical protein [Streptomyces luteolifulvus]|uniref:hypothetical protein n=1 Tax=Streptomyces luteolifulvus TaxID=2615112 RepID=UPI0017808A9F|nr:hypothetical protein [Streptomyces luteolifulvus]
MAVQDVHFHCPKCHPELVVGATPAICGRTIQHLVLGAGRERKCASCKQKRRDHEQSHR